MTIHVRYHNILQRAAGTEHETIELPAGASIAEAVKHVANHHGMPLREMLLGPEGNVASYLVIFHNGQLVEQKHLQLSLADGDELMLFLAISGG